MEEAWLILFQPHNELVTREVIGHSEAEEYGDIQIPSRWNKLVTESMISLNHQACLWIEILCTILNFFPILNLTIDINIECLQLNQYSQEGR